MMLLGGRSPYNELTLRQAAALREELTKRGASVPVAVGMRNWDTVLADSMRVLARRGARRVLGLHHGGASSEASFERYQRNVDEARAAMGDGGARGRLSSSVARPSAVHRGGGVARARGIRATRSAGAIACAADIHRAQYSGSRWRRRARTSSSLRESARMVAAELGIDTWTTRVSEPQRQSARSVARARYKRRAARTSTRQAAVVVPIGFLCDHVEVLYDLDIEAAQVAREAGVTDGTRADRRRPSAVHRDDGVDRRGARALTRTTGEAANGHRPTNQAGCGHRRRNHRAGGGVSIARAGCRARIPARGEPARARRATAAARSRRFGATDS